MKLTKKVLKKIIAEEVNKLRESSPQGFEQMAQMQPREYEAMTQSHPVTGADDPRAEHLNVLVDGIREKIEPIVMKLIKADTDEFGLNQDDINYVMGGILGK